MNVASLTCGVVIGLAAALGACASRRSAQQEINNAKTEDRNLPCGDMIKYRALALELATHPELRAAIERWNPPEPVSLTDRDAISAVARAYIATCGPQETVELAAALIAFPTVSAEAPAPDHPAFTAMAQYLQKWAEKNGLGFSVYGAHDVWEVTFGDGPRTLGFVMHADVVPVRETASRAADSASVAVTLSSVEDHPPDWTYPPFQAHLVEGKLYGRGSEDDKGPIAAALIVMRTLKMMGLEPRGQILAILGTGEEHDWSGMRRYVEARSPPDFVISLDANFPVVIAESGFVGWSLGIKRGKSDGAGASSIGPKILDARGGQFLTQVPGDASMLIAPDPHHTADELLQHTKVIAAEVSSRLGPGFEIEVRREKDGIRVNTKGDAVHSSVADEGKNALWPLAMVAAELKAAPTPTAKILELIASQFVGDHYGERVGLGYAHPLMGKLLVAPTVLRVTDESAVIDVNMRRPAGQTVQQFSAGLDRLLERWKKEIDPRIEEMGERYVGEPAMADPSSPLIPTLLEIYRRHTGKDARPVSIRGGTYARLFRGAVSFGPAFPGEPYRGHAPNEMITVEALDMLSRMLLDATLQLTAPIGQAIPRAERP